jgi:hypothetical protein
MAPQYYSSSQHIPNHGHVHAVAPPPRPESTQRKRPKYTRSKTGCLTCRVKKIKVSRTYPAFRLGFHDLVAYSAMRQSQTVCVAHTVREMYAYTLLGTFDRY